MNSRSAGLAVLTILWCVCLWCAGPYVAEAAAGASPRTAVMGGSGAFCEDERGALRWFGALADYPRLVYLDSGMAVLDGEDDLKGHGRGGGVHWGLGEFARAGVLALDLYRRVGSGREPLQLSGMYATRPGRYQLGLLGQMWTSGEDGDEPGRAGCRLGAGVRFEAGRWCYGDMVVELGGDSVEWLAGGIDESMDWDSYALRLRVFYGVGDDAVLVPVFEYSRDRYPDLDPFAGTVANNCGTHVRYGLGLDLLPDNDSQILLSISGRHLRSDWIAITDGQALNSRDLDEVILRAGFETRTLAWLTVRGGTRFLQGGSEGSRVEYSLGLGCHVGSADLFLLWREGAVSGYDVPGEQLAYLPTRESGSLSVSLSFVP